MASLSSSPPERPSLQRQSHSKGLGVRASPYKFGGNTVHPQTGLGAITHKLQKHRKLSYRLLTSKSTLPRENFRRAVISQDGGKEMSSVSVPFYFFKEWYQELTWQNNK